MVERRNKPLVIQPIVAVVLTTLIYGRIGLPSKALGVHICVARVVGIDIFQRVKGIPLLDICDGTGG